MVEFLKALWPSWFCSRLRKGLEFGVWCHTKTYKAKFKVQNKDFKKLFFVKKNQPECFRFYTAGKV